MTSERIWCCKLLLLSFFAAILAFRLKPWRVIASLLKCHTEVWVFVLWTSQGLTCAISPHTQKPYKNGFKSSSGVLVSVVVLKSAGAQLDMWGRPECVVHRVRVSLQSWATTTTSLYNTAVYIWIPSSQLNACDNNDSDGSH